MTGLYICAYVGHAVQCVRQGYALNPIKYLFITTSYGLWYFTSWHTNSVLVHGIAHRLMHGVQYIVIVYYYVDHKAVRTHNKRWYCKISAFGNIYYW